jgi:predicted Zn-dependent protease
MLCHRPQGGRAGAWVVAIAAVAAWNYYENKDNGKQFTNEDISVWNKDKKGSGKNE